MIVDLESMRVEKNGVGWPATFVLTLTNGMVARVEESDMRRKRDGRLTNKKVIMFKDEKAELS